MAESARASRGGARPEVKALEGRMLLSNSARGVSVPDIRASFPRLYVSQQSGHVDLTVTRPAGEAGRALRFQLRNMEPPTMLPAAGTEGPQRRIRMTGRDPSALPFVPIAGTYRFAPGQTSLTIPLRLNPNFVTKRQINLGVMTHISRYGELSHARAYVTIEPSEDLVPPEVVSASLTPQAITLTFSKPMDPVTVEDLNNYQVTGIPSATASPPPAAPNRRSTRVPFVTPPSPAEDPSPQPVALESAAYDPATRTVTLTPTEPLTLANYSVSAIGRRPGPSGEKPLTDLRGNALVGWPSLDGATIYVGIDGTVSIG